MCFLACELYQIEHSRAHSLRTAGAIQPPKLQWNLRQDYEDSEADFWFVSFVFPQGCTLKFTILTSSCDTSWGTGSGWWKCPSSASSSRWWISRTAAQRGPSSLLTMFFCRPKLTDHPEMMVNLGRISQFRSILSLFGATAVQKLYFHGCDIPVVKRNMARKSSKRLECI